MVGEFLQQYGLLVALAAAAWVLYDGHRRGLTWVKAIFWALATFLVLIIFLPLWLYMRPPLPRPDDKA
jgi:hypothetical protein